MGRYTHRFLISLTEFEINSLVVVTRIKSRVPLLRTLLYAEYYNSLKKELKNLKFYFQEYYDSEEFRLLQDLILQTEGKPKEKYNKRLQFLLRFKLLKEVVTKQDCVTRLAGLELIQQQRSTKATTTKYGWVKHYKDHGNLPPAKPDYSLTPKELEDEYLYSQRQNESLSQIRRFLLSDEKTDFSEIFPNFSKILKMETYGQESAE